MTINWFPGHMHKARKEIAQVMDEIDAVIEVLDARLPLSSENPLVNSLRKGKPVLKVLNKSDLADPVKTAQWLEYFNGFENIQAISISQDQKKLIHKIPDICKRMVPARVNKERPVRVMIMGIPNVGKSTLINTLLGRRIAKVGNEPAVTKTQTRYILNNGMALLDTPGFLWPKIEDQESGYRLAASGAIRDTAIEYELVALFAAQFMLTQYPGQLIERYKFKALPIGSDELLDEIGRKRGGLRPGGVVDRHKASEVLLHDMRGGKIGAITFETVEEWLFKQAEVERLRLEEIAEQLRIEAEAKEQALKNSQSHYMTGVNKNDA
ncbi:ribosome biogenesis GTPase YlqF [Neptunomonas antarctica]|uniref:Ribosome biogenesis GTPase A n=1 Tax=Neptunomonas antarctica TaxID=619304 RepID=A0A1N7LNH5_9GAMM|nr:ribosome biogenesis GTPase YlqF [Neptunomonas antarctica]SIS75339.1 Ras superfamily GTP-binding protein YlqF [Neptunomonas antarctica]